MIFPALGPRWPRCSGRRVQPVASPALGWGCQPRPVVRWGLPRRGQEPLWGVRSRRGGCCGRLWSQEGVPCCVCAGAAPWEEHVGTGGGRGQGRRSAGTIRLGLCRRSCGQAPAVLGVSQTLPRGSGGPRRPPSLSSSHGVTPSGAGRGNQPADLPGSAHRLDGRTLSRKGAASPNPTAAPSSLPPSPGGAQGRWAQQLRSSPWGVRLASPAPPPYVRALALIVSSAPHRGLTPAVRLCASGRERLYFALFGCREGVESYLSSILAFLTSQNEGFGFSLPTFAVWAVTFMSPFLSFLKYLFI